MHHALHDESIISNVIIDHRFCEIIIANYSLFVI